MPPANPIPMSRRTLVVVILLLLLGLIVFLYSRCRRAPVSAPAAAAAPAAGVSAASPSQESPGPTANAAPKTPENLTAATITAPKEIGAGAVFKVEWTGPDNRGDYITIVPPSASASAYENYVDTSKGPALELAAPVVPGDYELRYVTLDSKTILGRSPIRVLAADATLEAPAEVTAGKPFEVKWTGPNNAGDYVTIVTKETPDGGYQNYAETAKGSPLTLTALINPGVAELRYMTGSGARVVARRPIAIVAAPIKLDAPGDVVAGGSVSIVWSGPDNKGDYLTIVPKAMKDGQYAGYANTDKGSPAQVEAPIEPGPAEIRYMSGQGAKVLARRDLTVVPAKVTLKGPAKAAADSAVSVEWTGPKNTRDYLTIVPKTAKDGVYLHTFPAARNSPASLRMPKETGPAEIRYMSGQGNRVLGRADIECVANE